MNPTTRHMRLPRLSLTILFIGIALTAALYAITAKPSPSRPHAASPHTALAAGTLSVGNSKDGTAVLSAGGLVPGSAPVQGTVTISNGGSLPGAFSLSKNVTGGSALAKLLHMAIVDQTSRPTVHDGSVAGLGTPAP